MEVVLQLCDRVPFTINDVSVSSGTRRSRTTILSNAAQVTLPGHALSLRARMWTQRAGRLVNWHDVLRARDGLFCGL